MKDTGELGFYSNSISSGNSLHDSYFVHWVLGIVRDVRRPFVQNLLLERHGRVADLTLCKGSFTESNELADDMRTLEEYGIEGAPRGTEPPVIVPLFYDFKPAAYMEPLLLVSPHLQPHLLQ